MISTEAGSSPRLTTVRVSCGSSRANVPAGVSISRPSTTRLGDPLRIRKTSSWSRSVSSCSGIRSPGGISTRFIPNADSPSERRASSQLPVRSRSSRFRIVTPSKSMAASLHPRHAPLEPEEPGARQLREDVGAHLHAGLGADLLSQALGQLLHLLVVERADQQHAAAQLCRPPLL